MWFESCLENNSEKTSFTKNIFDQVRQSFIDRVGVLRKACEKLIMDKNNNNNNNNDSTQEVKNKTNTTATRMMIKENERQNQKQKQQ